MAVEGSEGQSIDAESAGVVAAEAESIKADSAECAGVDPGPTQDEEAELGKALEASSVLEAASKAASALAPLLPDALRRARVAEHEVACLRKALQDAEGHIEAMRAQQLRLSEGFTEEIRQRDAELAALRAATSKGKDEEILNPEVLSFVQEGPLGVSFDRSNVALKVVSAVAAGSLASGQLAEGDEVVSVCGTPARGLQWDEFGVALAQRPLVLSVCRGSEPIARSTSATSGASGPSQSSTSKGGGATPTPRASAGASGRGGLAQGMRNIAGWTRGMAKTVGRELEAAIGDKDAFLSGPPEATQAADGGKESPASLEEKNRPFYELVRTSMREAQEEAERDPGPDPGHEAKFERWLRNFHSERDDEWYAKNHFRIFHAFRPHWDEVETARLALSAS